MRFNGLNAPPAAASAAVMPAKAVAPVVRFIVFSCESSFRAARPLLPLRKWHARMLPHSPPENTPPPSRPSPGPSLSLPPPTHTAPLPGLLTRTICAASSRKRRVTAPREHLYSSQQKSLARPAYPATSPRSNSLPSDQKAPSISLSRQSSHDRLNYTWSASTAPP